MHSCYYMFAIFLLLVCMYRFYKEKIYIFHQQNWGIYSNIFSSLPEGFSSNFILVTYVLHTRNIYLFDLLLLFFFVKLDYYFPFSFFYDPQTEKV